ncbi:mucin-2-like [Neoarius graeffei]|uniref:mucin-2-like n=1 Tax=Neoarius graeffei TaxID=443677 RepID=UPI00298D487C|nr:mucin-2-like [Neoarius graeffei]
MIRKKGLLQDNSWIKKDVEEDEPVDDDPNYGKDVLSSLKPWTSTESKSTYTTQSNTANLNTSVTTTTKRFSESEDFTNKSTSPTATKPPVPEKKTVLTSPSNTFTARVFSGANSSERLKSTETYTTSEKTYPSFTSKTETYSTNLNQSSAMKELADDLIPPMSPSIQTNPTRSPLDRSYNTSQQINTTEIAVSPTVKVISHVSQTPAPSTPSRIVGKRDLCSFCAKSITEGERIILDDLQIFSHTFCFKCDMCFHALGNLEAGDSLWVHRGRVTCDNCYIKTKDKWYR